MKKEKAFTMAEILISLTIIGVIAALTLPALIANLNEKVWNTQRHALHSRMAQALAAMPRLDGYQETTEGSAAYNFVLNGLTSALNITKVCEAGKLTKCDFPTNILPIYDEFQPLDLSDDNRIVSFNTVNGESIAVIYNTLCIGSTASDFLTMAPQNLVCADFLYDLNGGSKGPNKLGKDMGIILAYFPEYPLVVAPMPAIGLVDTNASYEAAEQFAEQYSDYRLPTATEVLALSDYLDISPVWADDNVLYLSNSEPCKKTTEGGAYVVLVSKNGSAVPNFDIVGSNMSFCSKPDPDPGYCNCVEGEWVCRYR